MDEVRGRAPPLGHAARGSCASPGAVRDPGARAQPLGRAAWGSRPAPGLYIWWLRWWRPGHLVVAVVFLFLGLKHEKERVAFLGFFSSSISSFFFLACGFDFLISLLVYFIPL